jgi:hypothetical protein
MLQAVAATTGQDVFETPAVRGGPAGDWYVLQTRSRQERILARELGALGIVSYVPTVRQGCRFDDVEVPVDLPLFPGFVFLRGSQTDVRAAQRTGRVAGVTDVEQQRQVDHELRNIHRALSAGARLTACVLPGDGVPAVVRHGPFRGVRGVVAPAGGGGGGGRLTLPVHVLGRAAELDVADAALDRGGVD